MQLDVSSQKKALIWSAIGKISSQMITVIVSLVIARLLSPSDYGVIALLNIFMLVAQSLVDSGFTNALIQKKDRNEIDFSTVFYFNIGISLLLYILLYFSATSIAIFYGQPQLVLITRICSINIVIQGLAIIQRSKLIIALHFKEMATVTLISVIISGTISITMAWQQFGVYALLTQTISMNLFTTIGLWILSPWCPQKRFSYISFQQLFSFGSKLMIGGLLHTVYTNLYSLIIGKWYSLTDVGVFMKSNSLSKMPSLQLMTVLDQVSYPLLCSVQNQDIELKKLFFKYMRLACFIIFPIMAIFAVLAEPIVMLILTDRWIDMVPFFRILCIAYMFEPIQRYNWQILNVKGRSDLSLKSEVIKKSISIFLLIGALQINVLTICYSILLYALLDIWIILFFVKRVISIKAMEEWKQIRQFLYAAIISALATYLVTLSIDVVWQQILIGGLVGIGAYIALCKITNCPELNYIKL